MRLKSLWSRVTRRFWAQMPEEMLRQHIVESEIRWSGKLMPVDELDEHVDNWRRWRWRWLR